MSISFVYRTLSGYYRGSLFNPIADYIKISNMLLEAGRDLASLDSRLTALEANMIGIVTNANFLPGTINGNIITTDTLPGSTIQDGSITGDKLAINSIHGIVDTNIAANANINPSKINLSLLSHTQIKDIGANTHPQIDQFMLGQARDNAIFNSLISSLQSTTSSLNTSLATLNAYVAPAHLSTTAQVVSSAINELFADFQSVGASGTFITGPGSPTLHAITRWGASNTSLLDSSVILDNSNNITTPANLYFTTAGQSIGDTTNPLGTLNTAIITAPSGFNLTLNTSRANTMTLNGGQDIHITAIGNEFLTANNVDVTNTLGNGFFIGSDDKAVILAPHDVSIYSSGTQILLDTGTPFGYPDGGSIEMKAPSGVIEMKTGALAASSQLLATGSLLNLQSYNDANLTLTANGSTNSEVRLFAGSNGTVLVGKSNVHLVGGQGSIDLDNAGGASTGDMVIGSTGSIITETFKDDLVLLQGSTSKVVINDSTGTPALIVDPNTNLGNTYITASGNLFITASGIMTLSDTVITSKIEDFGLPIPSRKAMQCWPSADAMVGIGTVANFTQVPVTGTGTSSNDSTGFFTRYTLVNPSLTIVSSTSTADTSMRFKPSFYSKFRINTLTDPVFFTGLFDTGDVNTINNAGDFLPNQGIAVRFSVSAGDTNFQILWSDGISPQIADSGIAVDANPHEVFIDVGTVSTRVRVDNGTPLVITSNLPTIDTALYQVVFEHNPQSFNPHSLDFYGHRILSNFS